METFRTLQTGRALAAVAVVAHHAVLAAKDFGKLDGSVLEYGWLGVDFFFVLSGFIIAHSAPGKTLGEFGWHRLRRVLLPYLPIGLGMALLYAANGGHPFDWGATFMLWPFGTPALSVAWTLQHEVTFYVIFALCFFLRLYWLLAAWGIACLLGFSAIPFRPINLEFIMGIAAYLAVRRGWQSPLLLAFSTVPLMIWLFLGATRELSPLVGLAFAIALPAALRWKQTPFQQLGAASYSIYLAHGLAISIAARIWPIPFVLLIAGVVGGLIYYAAVERPILRIVGKRLPSVLARRASVPPLE